jgi:hypothetical protein
MHPFFLDAFFPPHPLCFSLFSEDFPRLLRNDFDSLGQLVGMGQEEVQVELAGRIENIDRPIEMCSFLGIGSCLFSW